MTSNEEDWLMETSVKVRFRFHPADVERPFIHLLATRFGLTFSILQADISPDKGGRMVMDLAGEENAIEEAVRFAAEQNVDVKILSRVVHWDDKVCVHCGSCTAVCRTQALSLDPETAMLSFDNARCVVCEMCVKVCPTGALSVELSS